MEPKELLTKRRIEKLASEFGNENVMDFTVRNEKRGFDVFVSHSSHDREFIRKVLLFLKYCKGGINGYVDWQDPDMEHETDARTALDIKSRILHSRKVIYVVTSESLKSVWCSWEIGFADSCKGVNDVAILAVKPNNGYWKNHEFLQQYPWITYDQERHFFMVTMTNGDRITLFEWLMQNFRDKD